MFMRGAAGGGQGVVSTWQALGHMSREESERSTFMSGRQAWCRQRLLTGCPMLASHPCSMC